MGLEEVTFTNTNGEEISISNLVNQMINYYGLKQEVGETVLTDFNEGSEIRNLLEAFAVCIYALLDEQHEATRIAFISTSEGVFLDRIGELPFINLARVAGDYSTGEVTFTLSEIQSVETVIPAGTIVACSDSGLEFSTDDDCFIPVGELTGDVSVTALTVGADCNVASNSVDLIVDTIVDTNLVSVNNTTSFGNGADYEDDESYRTRLLENVQADGFGTVGYYNSLCENVDGVHDVLLVNDAGYTKKVLVNGTVKPVPDSVLLDVLTVLSTASNHVLNHSFTVDRPVYTSVDLTITLDVASEISTNDLLDNLTAFVDGLSYDRMDYTGLNINESLTRDMVVEACMVFGDVVDVSSVVCDGVELSTVSPAGNGVLVLDDVVFVQNEV